MVIGQRRLPDRWSEQGPKGEDGLSQCVGLPRLSSRFLSQQVSSALKQLAAGLPSVFKAYMACRSTTTQHPTLCQCQSASSKCIVASGLAIVLMILCSFCAIVCMPQGSMHKFTYCSCRATTQLLYCHGQQHLFRHCSQILCYACHCSILLSSHLLVR